MKTETIQKLIAHHLSDAFNRECFNICGVRTAATLLGIDEYPSDELRACHCVSWDIIGDKRSIMDIVEKELNINIEVQFVN